MYRVTKRYGHEEGLSCAFRQWRAKETHCRFIHGYPLAFTFTFESETLDERNWVISFGELKQLKQKLKDEFDHKTCIAHDDPELQLFLEMEEFGVIQLNIVRDVGCEKFAEYAYNLAVDLLKDKMQKNNVRLVEVTCSEHGGNSATYISSTPNLFPDLQKWLISKPVEPQKKDWKRGLVCTGDQILVSPNTYILNNSALTGY